jgi:hypothetical protein
MWRSLVAHLTGGQGAVGSNPAIPTKTFTDTSQIAGRFNCYAVTARRLEADSSAVERGVHVVFNAAVTGQCPVSHGSKRGG